MPCALFVCILYLYRIYVRIALFNLTTFIKKINNSYYLYDWSLISSSRLLRQNKRYKNFTFWSNQSHVCIPCCDRDPIVVGFTAGLRNFVEKSINHCDVILISSETKTNKWHAGCSILCNYFTSHWKVYLSKMIDFMYPLFSKF